MMWLSIQIEIVQIRASASGSAEKMVMAAMQIRYSGYALKRAKLIFVAP